jgi:hypothetical protein
MEWFQLSILTFLGFGFIFAAYWLQSSEYIKHVAMFFATTICIQQLADAIRLKGEPNDNLADASEGELNTGVAGMSMCWITFVRAIPPSIISAQFSLLPPRLFHII